MVSAKEVTAPDSGDDDYWKVGFRPTSQFSKIRTPEWAANVADSVSSDALVRMGKTDAGNWLVKSVLIKKGYGKSRTDAKRLGKQVQRKIDGE